MTEMTMEEFNNRLDGIVERTNKELSDLVVEAFTREGKDMRDCEPISFRSEWNYHEVGISNLISSCGWVHDRMNGMTRLNRKSLTRKLRKVLGYTNP